MDDPPYRPLDPRERALLDLLLAEDFPGVPELRVQAITVLGRLYNDDPTLVELRVVDPDAPRAAIRTRVPVEAKTLNTDPPQDLLIHVVDGLLDCLELVTYGTELSELPDVTAFDRPWTQPTRS